MESEEKVMTGEESLRIITSMINKTKVNIVQSSFHLLFWGWLIVFCSLSEYILIRVTDMSTPWVVWAFVIPGIFISLIYGYSKGRGEKIYTYATSVYVWSWIGFLIAAVVLYIIQLRSMSTFSEQILILIGLPTFIGGFILRFTPLKVGGVAFWFFALVAHFTGPDIAGLCMPAAMVAGYLVPGYILKRRGRHDSV